MTAWAIIPARGGSKGVPGKNLAVVGGRTLVRRAVETCIATSAINRVIVSTDDDAISAEAHAAGAEVVSRPSNIAGDTASSESAVLHALGFLTADGSPPPEVVLLVQCSSPFTTSEDLDGLVRLVDVHDCAFTGARSHSFIWKRSSSGGIHGVNHDEAVRQRRQDLEPEYVETGNAYVMRTNGLLTRGHRFFGSVGIFEIDPNRWLEIDTPADLLRARYIAPSIDQLPAPSADRLAALKAVIFDFDGVLTDNKVIVHQDGTESVIAHRGDGYGISLLRECGVHVLVLSKERNPVVAARAAKLAVEVVHGCDDKLSAALAWLSNQNVDPASCAFVGNDVNDLHVMNAVGMSVCPSDAHPHVRAIAHWVLPSPGGNGAVRQLCEAITSAYSESDIEDFERTLQ